MELFKRGMKALHAVPAYGGHAVPVLAPKNEEAFSEYFPDLVAEGWTFKEVRAAAEQIVATSEAEGRQAVLLFVDSKIREWIDQHEAECRALLMADIARTRRLYGTAHAMGFSLLSVELTPGPAAYAVLKTLPAFTREEILQA